MYILMLELFYEFLKQISRQISQQLTVFSK